MGIENLICWDINNTSCGGPFKELLEVDIVVNCIYLLQPIAPFITTNFLNENKSKRSLSGNYQFMKKKKKV